MLTPNNAIKAHSKIEISYCYRSQHLAIIMKVYFSGILFLVTIVSLTQAAPASSGVKHVYLQESSASTAQQVECPTGSLGFSGAIKLVGRAVGGYLSGTSDPQPGDIFRVVSNLIERCFGEDNELARKTISRFQNWGRLVDIFAAIGRNRPNNEARSEAISHRDAVVATGQALPTHRQGNYIRGQNHKVLSQEENFDLGTFVDSLTNSLANFVDGDQDGNGITNGDVLRILSNALGQIDADDSRYITRYLDIVADVFGGKQTG